MSSESLQIDFVYNKSNETSEQLDSFYFYEVEQFTVLWLLFILIVTGNSGVLITLLLSKSRRNRMNYFITHLALADLLVGIINVLTDIIWRMTISWNAGNVMCKIVRYLQVLVTYASTYVLVALSIDRYDAIRHPMKFSTSWKRAKSLILSAWLLSACFSIPILFFYEEKSIEDQLQCWIEFSSQWQWRLYMTAVALSLFILPAIVITICYAVIIVTIRSKSVVSISKRYETQKVVGHRDPNGSKRVSSRGLIPRAKVKTVKITLVIVTAFILCWSPYIIFDLLQVYDHIPRTQTNVAIATLVQSLAPLNSAANPIIYCVFSTNLLKYLCEFAFLKRICPGKRRNSDGISQTNTKTSSLSEFLTHNTNAIRGRKRFSVGHVSSNTNINIQTTNFGAAL